MSITSHPANPRYVPHLPPKVQTPAAQLVLTQRQKRFAWQFIASGDAGKAALRAGYSRPAAGDRLLGRVGILNFIRSLMKNDEARAQVEVGVLSVIRTLKTEMTADYDDNRSQAGRLRAAELLAKFLGILTPETQQVDASQHLTINVTKWDGELAAPAAGQRQGEPEVRPERGNTPFTPL